MITRQEGCSHKKEATLEEKLSVYGRKVGGRREGERSKDRKTDKETETGKVRKRHFG